MQTYNRVLAGGQTVAQEQESSKKNNFSTIKPEIPDLTFLSKGQLRKRLEDEYIENAIKKASYDKRINELLKEVVFYQKMCSELLEEKTGQKINPSEIYLRIAG